MSDSFMTGFLTELTKLAAPAQQQAPQMMGPPSPTQMENIMLNEQLQNLQLKLQLKQMQQQLSAQEQQEQMQAQMQAQQQQEAAMAQQRQQSPDAMPQGPGGAPDGPIDPREMIGG